MFSYLRRARLSRRSFVGTVAVAAVRGCVAHNRAQPRDIVSCRGCVAAVRLCRGTVAVATRRRTKA
eukprot:7676904-Heterocapsa_arctica.AAC.1